MAKQSQKSRRKGEQRRDIPSLAVNLDDVLHKYIWLLVPILVIVYYLYSTGSTGFYQDDEIGHYRNIRQFWGNPFSIMGNQPKPGWKILMVVPGLFGFKGVLLAHCLVTALTVVMTYFAGRAMNIRNSSIGAILLGFQPLFLQLSFRSYSEITAGLFAMLMLYFYYKEQYAWAAIASSYIFSIRQEFAIVSVGLGVLLLLKKKWISFLLLGWTPVLLALIGWLHTGNAMWLLDDMRRIGLGVVVPHKSFWHYFQTYIFIVGPVTLTLFMAGFWSFLHPAEKWKEQLAKRGFLYFTFTSMFLWGVISAWEAIGVGANPGHWRYLLSISPMTALFASIGANRLLEKGKQGYAYAVLFLFALITLLFLSYESNGLTIGTTAEYGKLGMVALVIALFALTAGVRALRPAFFLVLLVAAGIGHTLATEKPRKLDAEAATVKEAAEWYAAETSLHDRPLLANHVLFRYFADIDINDKKRDVPLFKKTLDEAPVGAVCVWDSHYGESQFGGDVPYEYLENNPRFKRIREFIAPTQVVAVLVYEKVR